MTDHLTENARLRAALEWYGEQARLCRLIHREGDAGRNALADDGGKRARAALATPAPDAVQEAARVLLDSEGRALPRLVQIAEDQRDAGSSMSRCIGVALRAIAGGQP